jgi:hypothetical protein
VTKVKPQVSLPTSPFRFTTTTHHQHPSTSSCRLIFQQRPSVHLYYIDVCTKLLSDKIRHILRPSPLSSRSVTTAQQASAPYLAVRTTDTPIMASRAGPAAGRGMNTRFAQFKLVLLGMFIPRCFCTSGRY